MKKLLHLLLACALCVSVAACGQKKAALEGEVDVDLTQYSSTMVYSMVTDIAGSPGDYTGKTIRMKGRFNVYHDDAKNRDYFSCLVSDATACCAQGFEFKLKDGAKYPDDYPEDGATITVKGVFHTYTEDGYIWPELIDAEIA